MGLRNIFVYSHDSVAVGEDGPTHQPVEQLANLRTTPNLSLWRPCDAAETAYAWAAALNRRDGPTALVLTRQKTACQPRADLAPIAQGGYVLCAESGALDVIVIATGSEVELAVAAAQTVAELGVRVVSMPSVDVFPEPRTRRIGSSCCRPIAAAGWRWRPGIRTLGTGSWALMAPWWASTVLGFPRRGPEAMNAVGMNVDAVVAAIRQVAAGCR